MTLNDLFNVMWSIGSVVVTCRTDGNFLHEFYFSPDEPGGYGLRLRIASEEVTYIKAPVNVHGQPTRGGAETGWGFRRGSIPKELMEAEIVHLGITNYTRGYDVHIDTEGIPLMMVEYLRTNLEPKKWKAREEVHYDTDRQRPTAP